MLEPRPVDPEPDDPEVDGFEAGAPIDEPRRRPWVWGVYLLLYAVAIPWYWPADFRGPPVLGLPTWVAVTLLGAVALAAWTGFVIRRTWHDPEAG